MLLLGIESYFDHGKLYNTHAGKNKENALFIKQKHKTGTLTVTHCVIIESLKQTNILLHLMTILHLQKENKNCENILERTERLDYKSAHSSCNYEFSRLVFGLNKNG
jgi:hypothetical protein